MADYKKRITRSGPGGSRTTTTLHTNGKPPTSSYSYKTGNGRTTISIDGDGKKKITATTHSYGGFTKSTTTNLSAKKSTATAKPLKFTKYKIPKHLKPYTSNKNKSGTSSSLSGSKPVRSLSIRRKDANSNSGNIGTLILLFLLFAIIRSLK